MGTDLEQDWINKYLSALSISSDECVGSTVHIIAGENLYEPEHVPVWAPFVVDPSMAPSFILPPHPPSDQVTPSPPVSYNYSDEELGSPRFRAHEHHEHEPLHSTNPNSPIEALDKAFPSPSPSPPANTSQLPVSLPLHSPQWAQILATRAPCEGSAIDDLIRTVEEDVSRLHYFEDVENLRERSSQAELPLAPVPNVHGSSAPLVRIGLQLPDYVCFANHYLICSGRGPHTTVFHPQKTMLVEIATARAWLPTSALIPC